MFTVNVPRVRHPRSAYIRVKNIVRSSIRLSMNVF